MVKPFRPTNEDFDGEFKIEELRTSITLDKQRTQRRWTWWVIIREATILFTAISALAVAGVYDMFVGNGWPTVTAIGPWVTFALGYFFAVKTNVDKPPDG